MVLLVIVQTHPVVLGSVHLVDDEGRGVAFDGLNSFLDGVVSIHGVGWLVRNGNTL